MKLRKGSLLCVLTVVLLCIVFLHKLAQPANAASEAVTIDSSEYPESTHDYANSLNEMQTFSWPGAEKLVVTFSASTFVENNYDFIYLYDGSGTQIGKYTGSAAAGLTVEIPGDSFTIKLTSDGSVQKYGYSFSSIVAYMSASDLTFTLNSTGDGYIVSKCSVSVSGELVIPSTNNGLPVTDIGNYAFDGCTGLTSITIPEGVVSIGNYAFKRCTGLNNVAVPRSVGSIGNYAFDGCTSLSNVIYCGPQWKWDDIFIPGYNTSLAKATRWSHKYRDNACIFCQQDLVNALTFTLSNTGDSYLVCDCDESACGEITIPTTYNGLPVTGLTWQPFDYCTGLTSVTIPGSITNMGSYAFKGCTGLTAVTICEGITRIADRMFLECTSLTNISIPDSVTCIDVEAFRDCTSLTTITIPESVTRIGGDAFYNCKNLSYSIYENGKYLGNNSNPYFALLGTDSWLSLSQIHPNTKVLADGAFANRTNYSIDIPEGVTSIGFQAFSGCTDLSRITIPDSVVNIYDYAFYGCTSLSSISLPEKITNIGGRVFYNCTALSSITIPECVTSIGEAAFTNCTGLVNVTIPDSVNSIGRWAFNGCDKLATVIYCGDQKQWDAIKINSDNTPLTEANLQFHNYENNQCTFCGQKIFAAGDIDGNNAVDHNDAVYLLLHTMFSEETYPLNGANADIDGNGTVEQEDAVYLLLHSLFGEAFYPLKKG